MEKDVNEIFTGERFVPGVEDDEIEIEHYQRYESILPLVRDKVVVDAACGEGYGSSILGATAKHVTGIDICKEAVERATETYGCEKVDYKVGDISCLQLEDSSVDVFVSFETIEHVDAELQQKFVHEVARVLKEDGVFVISSPNKAIYSDLFHYENKFHVHELYKNEFEDLLKTEFPCIMMYNQYLEVASVIDNNDTIADQAKYKKDTNTYTSDGKYLIAVASRQPMQYPNIQSVYLKREVTYRKNIQRIYTLQDEEEKRNKHLAELDKEIERKDARIVELQDEHEQDVAQLLNLRRNHDDLRSNHDELRKIHDELRLTHDELKKSNEELKKSNEELKKSNEELKEQVDARDYKLGRDEQLIHDKDVHIGNLESFIKIKDDYINSVQPLVAKAQQMENNRFIRLAKLPVRAARKVKRMVAENKSIHKLNVPVCDKPLVSIVIPVYNQFDYTYNCIKSIIENTKDVDYEIIIGDDVSTDQTAHIQRYVKGIKVVRNRENLKFLLNCNHAAKSAKGQYILFLNNDTTVKENWLSSLVQLIESDNRIGMVGSKLIYPDGRLQEAGGIIWKDASAWNYGNGQDPEKADFNYVRDVDYISGAAIMIRKSLWKEIGGFDELFVPAYCEDSDLAFEVRKHGYRVVYQPASVVVHYEGVSNGTDTSTGLKHYQVVNNEKLQKKWAKELAEHYENGSHVLKAKDRCFGDRKLILFIDHYVPQFDKDAGSRTVFQYVKMFVQKGYDVKFIGDNYFKHEPYTTVLNNMGVEVLHGPWYAEHIFEWLEANKESIDYVFMNRPHISVKYIDFFKEKMNAKIIYYGHDLHFLRITREYELTGDENKRKEALDWKEKELSLMHKADVVYYPSEVEATLIKEIDENINVKALVPYVYDEFKKVKREPSKNKGILFVGGFSHTPNIDAVKWFVEEVYPKIKEKENIPFYVAGSNPTEEILSYNGNGIDVKGFVSDEELEALYNNCKLVVVPLRYGAGVKGKVIEAIYNGVPIVTTSVGAEGIPEAESILEIYDTPSEFAEAVVNLYHDDKELEAVSEKMQKYVKKHNSVEAAWKVVGPDFS